jgi:hypothetical protein
MFVVVRHQLSSLPGWQEGAIASSLNALGVARGELAELLIDASDVVPSVEAG